MDQENAQSGIVEGDYYVTNDSWNTGRYAGLSQAIYVCNYNSWYTIATMNNDTFDGAVKTSPNVQETWYPTPTKLASSLTCRPVRAPLTVSGNSSMTSGLMVSLTVRRPRL